MKTGKLNYATPQELEERRIAEIRALSYVQRLERLMAILEISHMMKNADKSTVEYNERANNKHLEVPA